MLQHNTTIFIIFVPSTNFTLHVADFLIVIKNINSDTHVLYYNKRLICLYPLDIKNFKLQQFFGEVK